MAVDGHYFNVCGDFLNCCLFFRTKDSVRINTLNFYFEKSYSRVLIFLLLRWTFKPDLCRKRLQDRIRDTRLPEELLRPETDQVNNNENDVVQDQIQNKIRKKLKKVKDGFQNKVDQMGTKLSEYRFGSRNDLFLFTLKSMNLDRIYDHDQKPAILWARFLKLLQKIEEMPMNFDW